MVNDVCYWDLYEGRLKGSQKSKAKKFFKFGCVKKSWLFENTFYVSPLYGYNHNTYIIKNNGENFVCNCQFNTKNKALCSHILAVFLYLKEKNKQG